MKQTLPVVALVGLTNVGKSSLFNALLGKTRAVVAFEQHTTRDYIDDTLRLAGQAVRLVDTAGYGDGDNYVTSSTAASSDIIGQANLIVFVIDGTVPISQLEKQLVRKLQAHQKNIILVVHKADKAKQLADYQKLGITKVFFASSTTKTGIEQLREVIFANITQITTVRENSSPIAVSLIGRPNVGKSSLFNRLTDSARSLISSQSGTTRDMITADISHQSVHYQIADTAGIRRPGKRGKGIERFSATRTSSAIGWSDICLLVLDATELGVHQDLALAGEIIAAGKGLILVVNKIDELKNSGLTRAQILSILKSRYQFCYWAPVSLISAKTGTNIEKLFAHLVQVHNNQTKMIPTAKLNRILMQLVDEHPPATTGTGRVKLNYITQTATTPPTFTLFTNKPHQIHFSYRRYIENNLRNQLDFNGTPIKLVFKEKH